MIEDQSKLIEFPSLFIFVGDQLIKERLHFNFYNLWDVHNVHEYIFCTQKLIIS